tara:strand:- start:25 stop:1275 length:1251 start_codon:yes stop_codon:yes gene_type:complete
MKIAIIGGGSSGMISAHLLCRKHDVTLYEKAPIFGGNIRTLNGNVATSNVPKDITVEAGVTAFHYPSSPTMRSLLQNLQVPYYLSAPKLASSIQLLKRQRYTVPSFFTLNQYGFMNYLKASKINVQLFPDVLKMLWRMSLSSHEKTKTLTMGSFINHTSALSQRWMRCSIMLGLSMPFIDTKQFPCSWLKTIFFKYRLPIWASPKNGMYDYIDKIITLNQNHFKYHCNVAIQTIMRSNSSATIVFNDGTMKVFDKIIFATTPEQVLKLLESPTEHEKKRFHHWRERSFSILSHTDNSLYDSFVKPSPSPFDYFEKNNSDFGYNTYLNDIHKIKGETSYNFSYNLDERINPNLILMRMNHTVPIYNNKSIKYNEEILQTNGDNNTFHVGAYLGHGLHESAAKTAYMVALKLGGLVLV